MTQIWEMMLKERKVRIPYRRDLIILSNEAIKIRLNLTSRGAKSGTQTLIKGFAVSWRLNCDSVRKRESPDWK